MPELPEVETIASKLAPLIQEKIITNVRTSGLKLRSQLSEIDKQSLPGNKVLSVTRVGKYLVIELLDKYLLIHFGMSGRLIVAQNEIEMRKATNMLKHIHLCLNFSNFFILYQDPRRFGSIRIVNKAGPKPTKQLSTLFGVGFEPCRKNLVRRSFLYYQGYFKKHKNFFDGWKENCWGR